MIFAILGLIINILFLWGGVLFVSHKLDKLEKQQQKDRSDIADYLNEQLKNK